MEAGHANSSQVALDNWLLRVPLTEREGREQMSRTEILQISSEATQATVLTRIDGSVTAMVFASFFLFTGIHERLWERSRKSS